MRTMPRSFLLYLFRWIRPFSSPLEEGRSSNISNTKTTPFYGDRTEKSSVKNRSYYSIILLLSHLQDRKFILYTFDPL